MTIPPELIEDLQQLQDRWQDTPLARWLPELPEQCASGLSLERYGDLPRWREALASLPAIASQQVHLNQACVGASGDIDAETRASLETALRGLHPWRKGPYELFGVHIDTEWHSDWKWDRLLPGLESLEGRRVLDVGCGSGYHCWRMLGAGAAEVIGIDPTPLFVLQFKAIQRYLAQPNIYLLPLGIEAVPPKLKAFDTVFSMGVLYHRRSPMDHLTELRDTLTKGGQLVLETLVVEGDRHTVFVPPGRYARMGNVWFLPSTDALCGWLEKVGFKSPQLIDLNRTNIKEQRQTDWMQFHSLEQFLNPEDHRLTVEGHPAPLRAVITATAP
ncbi:MAG: tRNA 5-methoxyuridine(34)/uridine 5-oxyacetic acid(34) synthase CmoB [Halieaceae bacterium]|jgi:tRNA (mo5U34)-methyltransferase|nr:tRNA 5-methoxyuridine(34)/uridine 5-oxyacetic acid(34) synthase CmoB [Halieaceae bacterium]